MNIGQLAPQVYVTGQITECDLQDLVDRGVRSIINNRPDDEAAGQPRSADLAAIAEGLGMVFLYVPVVSGAITEANVTELRETMQELEKPVLLFCRSGTRCTILWQRTFSD